MSSIDNNKFENEIKLLGIHDLRVLARNYGVKSPTTLKKEELIELILKVYNGELTPVKNNMGRKPKASTHMRYDTPSILPPLTTLVLNSPTIDTDREPFDTQGIFTFNSSNDPVFTITESSGRLYTLPTTERVMFKYNLKKNDIVTLRLQYLKDHYFKYNIDQIITINGISAEDYNRDSFNDLISTFNPNDYLILDNSEYYDKLLNKQKIKRGQNSFIYHRDNNTVKEACYQFCKSILNENTDFVILNSDARNVVPSDQENIEIFSLNIDKNYEELCNDIIIVQEKVKNMLVNGKQIVFVINELEDIFKIFNYNIQKTVTDIISPDAITAVRRLLNTAKYVSKDQNLTVVIFSSLSKSVYSNTIIEDILKHLYTNILPKSIKDRVSY